jgi:hypothetical protein
MTIQETKDAFMKDFEELLRRYEGTFEVLEGDAFVFVKKYSHMKLPAYINPNHK